VPAASLGRREAGASSRRCGLVEVAITMSGNKACNTRSSWAMCLAKRLAMRNRIAVFITQPRTLQANARVDTRG